MPLTLVWETKRSVASPIPGPTLLPVAEKHKGRVIKPGPRIISPQPRALGEMVSTVCE